jgi:hypothetical protein
MRVPAHDDVESGCARIEVERVDIVKHENGGDAGFDDFGFGQRGSPRFGIHVSPHGYDRRQGFERVDDFRLPYVSRVNN